jgi:hypothetical protein
LRLSWIGTVAIYYKTLKKKDTRASLPNTTESNGALVEQNIVATTETDDPLASSSEERLDPALTSNIDAAPTSSDSIKVEVVKDVAEEVKKKESGVEKDETKRESDIGSFDWSLLTNAGSDVGLSIGTILNIMSSDAQVLSDLAVQVPSLYTAPVQLILALVFLYR